MKTLSFLLVALAGLALFVSCEKKPPVEPPEEKPQDASLDGSTWTLKYHWDDFENGRGGLDEIELVFTATTVETSCTSFPSGLVTRLTGTYIYDPPTVTVTVVSPEHLAGEVYTGTEEEVARTVMDTMSKIRFTTL